MTAYTLGGLASEKYIECHTCHRRSFHPADIERLYCGCCHVFHRPSQDVLDVGLAEIRDRIQPDNPPVASSSLCPQCDQLPCHDCGCCGCDRSDKGHGCKTGRCPCFGPAMPRIDPDKERQAAKIARYNQTMSEDDNSAGAGSDSCVATPSQDERPQSPAVSDGGSYNPAVSWPCPDCQAMNQHPETKCRVCGGQATFKVSCDQDAGMDRVLAREMIDFESDNSAGVGSDSDVEQPTQPDRPHHPAASPSIGGIIYPPDVLRNLAMAIEELIVASAHPDRAKETLPLWPVTEILRNLAAAEPAGVDPAALNNKGVYDPVLGYRPGSVAWNAGEEPRWRPNAAEPAGDSPAVPTVEVEIEGVCKVRDGKVPSDCRSAMAAAEPAGKPPDDWQCFCGCNNRPNQVDCYSCGTPRIKYQVIPIIAEPAEPMRPPGYIPDPMTTTDADGRPVVWQCPYCDAVNRVANADCWRCCRPSRTIGVEPASHDHIKCSIHETKGHGPFRHNPACPCAACTTARDCWIAQAAGEPPASETRIQ